MARNRVEIILDARDLASGKVDRLIGKLNNGVAGGARKGTLQANALGFALDKAFDLGVSGARAFGRALSQADEIVGDSIKAIGGLQSAIGSDFAGAERTFNKITQRLAENAATLPGTTSQYSAIFRQISDDVALANKSLNGGVLDTQQYEDQVARISSVWGALNSNLPERQSLLGITRLVNDASIAQLRTLKAFRDNPILINNLEKQLNGQRLQDLSKGQRLTVVMDALNATLTPETEERLRNTAGAAFEGFRSRLFDPNIGMFGLLRDLDGNLENGVQNAYQSIGRFSAAVFGPNGMFDSIGRLLRRLGLNADPMRVLAQAVDNVTLFVKDTTAFFDKLGEVRNIDFAGVVDAGYDRALKMAEQIDWEAVGFQVGRFIFGVAQQLIKIAIKTPFAQARIGRQLLIGLSEALLSGITGAAYAGVEMVIKGIADHVLSNPMSIIMGPAEQLRNLLQWAADKIFDFIGEAVRKGLAQAVNTATFGLSGFASTKFGKQAGGAALQSAQNIPVVGGAVKAGGNMFNDAMKEIGNFGPTRWLSDTIFGTNRAMGQLSAGSPLAKEIAMMPSGAKPVVANSSEDIFNRSQQRDLAAMIRGGGGSTTFAPVINIQGNADRSTVDYLLAELERRFSQYQAAYN